MISLHRFKLVIAGFAAITTLATGTSTSAATNGALADKVIKQLEASGALDSAVDRAIERRAQREVDKRQKAAEDERKHQNEMSKNARKVDPARDHLFGDETARISVIVYSDMECPYCKRFAGVPESAAAKFEHQVNVVWRHFPLEMHGANARLEANAAECVAKQAGNEGFFNFVNQVLKLSRANGQGLADGDQGVFSLAKQSGAKDEQSFKACLEEPQTKAAVDDDMKDGLVAGIEGTPGVILRDNVTGQSTLVGGAVPQIVLEDQLRAMLAEKKTH